MYALYPLAAVLIWSINAIITKMSASAIDPGAISFYRWFLAFLVLTPFILPSIIRSWSKIKPHLFHLFILGGLGMMMYQSLSYYAAQTVTALFIGILNAVIPLLTILLSVTILKLRPTLGIAIGSILSFAGLVWLVSKGEPIQLIEHGLGIGELMMFIASFSYALYGVLMKRWQINLPSWQALYMQIFFGVLLLIPLFIYSPDASLNQQNIPLVLFAGIASSIAAPFLWIKGLEHLGANKASLFMNLAPIFTAIIAVLFLHESLNSYHLIGGGIALAGVILAQSLRRPMSKS